MKSSRFLLLVCVASLSRVNGFFRRPEKAPKKQVATKEEGPQRGRHLPTPLSGRDVYRAYQDLKEEYTRVLDSKKWKVLSQKPDGTSVSLLTHPNDPTCPYVRLTATVPGISVADCWDYLRIDNWPESMPRMNPYFEGYSVHGHWTHRGVHMSLVRIRLHRIGGLFGKRDQAFVSVSDAPHMDGTRWSGTVSVETPKVPRKKGYTRAFQDSIGIYRPRGKEMDLTIVFRIDLNDQLGGGGIVPMFLYVQTVGRTGIQSMQRMKEALLEAKHVPRWKRLLGSAI